MVKPFPSLDGEQKVNMGKHSTPGAGRPEKPIDWALVDAYLLSGCSGVEIAPHFNMHYTTFYDRVKEKYGKNFTEYAAEKHEKGNSLLRHQQYKKALGVTKEGDNTLLIWLGKNRLKQSDSPTDTGIDEKTVTQFNAIMSMLDKRQEAARKREEIKTSEETKS